MLLLRVRTPRIPSSNISHARYSCTFVVQEWALDSKAGEVRQTSLRPDLPQLHAATQGTVLVCSAKDMGWSILC